MRAIVQLIYRQFYPLVKLVGSRRMHLQDLQALEYHHPEYDFVPQLFRQGDEAAFCYLQLKSTHLISLSDLLKITLSV